MNLKSHFSMLLLVTSSICVAQDNVSQICGIALKSRAFNTDDIAINTRLVIKKRDDACSNEYNSQGEAVAAGQSAGGGIGYGAFSFNASEAKQTSSSKWSISDSKLCKASAEELESVTSQRVKTQVANVALETWLDCIKALQQNRIFVQYSLSRDSTGFTGILHRSVSGEGGFGRIRSLSSSHDDADLKCQVGGSPVLVGKPLDIPIDRSNIGISCTKPKTLNTSILVTTDQGDQDWIDLPSSDAKRQTDIDAMNEAVAQLSKQLLTMKDQLDKNIDARLTTLSSRLDTVAKSAFKPTYIFDSSCPSGYKSAGTIGVIYEKVSGRSPIQTGADLGPGSGWQWVHPSLCVIN